MGLVETMRHLDPSGGTQVDLQLVVGGETGDTLIVRAGSFVVQGRRFELKEDEEIERPSETRRYSIAGALVRVRASDDVRVHAHVVPARGCSFDYGAPGCPYELLYPLFIVNMPEGGKSLEAGQLLRYVHEAPPKAPEPIPEPVVSTEEKGAGDGA